MFDALAHERGCLLNVRWQRVEPRQPIVVILECLEAQRMSQLICRLDSAELVEGDQVPAISVFFDFILVIFLKKIEIRAVGRRKVLALDGPQLGQNFDMMAVLFVDGIKASITPAVVPATIS